MDKLSQSKEEIKSIFKERAEMIDAKQELIKNIILDVTKPEYDLPVLSNRQKKLQNAFRYYGEKTKDSLYYSKLFFDFCHFKNLAKFKEQFIFRFNRKNPKSIKAIISSKLSNAISKIHIFDKSDYEQLQFADIDGFLENNTVCFEDILLIDDRSVQKLLREVDNEQLAIALLGQNAQIKDKFYRNMSIRATIELRHDMMRFLKKINHDEIHTKQMEILQIFLLLIQNGSIILPLYESETIIQ